jgi:hypothetical protein
LDASHSTLQAPSTRVRTRPASRYQVPVEQAPVGVLIEYVVAVMLVGAELSGGGPQKR